MRQAVIAFAAAALLITACDETVAPIREPLCAPEMREAREHRGHPSRITEYRATGYIAVTYYWHDQQFSMRFVAHRGKCDVSTYRSR